MDDKKSNPSNSSTCHAANEESVYDFTSENFKPLDSLKNPEKALPNLPQPKAKIFNNISEYANKTFQKSKMKPCTSSCSSIVQPVIERKFTQEQINSLVQTKKYKQPDNVLTLMDKADGPLLLLKRSLEQTVRILVMKIKSSNCAKFKVSWLTGRLIAFDKHLNLIIHNVIESSPDCSACPIDQLFVRGDSVILISTKV